MGLLLLPSCLVAAGEAVPVLPHGRSWCPAAPQGFTEHLLSNPPRLAPGGQILAQQGAGCIWRQELCPLPEGRAAKTFKTSMVLLPHPQGNALALARTHWSYPVLIPT